MKWKILLAVSAVLNVVLAFMLVNSIRQAEESGIAHMIYVSNSETVSVDKINTNTLTPIKP